MSPHPEPLLHLRGGFLVSGAAAVAEWKQAAMVWSLRAHRCASGAPPTTIPNVTQRKYTATTLELCASLGIGRKTVRHLIAEGYLQPGKHYRQHGVGKQRPRLMWDIPAVDQAISYRTTKLKVGQP